MTPRRIEGGEPDLTPGNTHGGFSSGAFLPPGARSSVPFFRFRHQTVRQSPIPESALRPPLFPARSVPLELRVASVHLVEEPLAPIAFGSRRENSLHRPTLDLRKPAEKRPHVLRDPNRHLSLLGRHIHIHNSLLSCETQGFWSMFSPWGPCNPGVEFARVPMERADLPDEKRRFSFAVYLAGDKNLSEEMVWSLQEMKAASREPLVRERIDIAALFDPRGGEPRRYDFTLSVEEPVRPPTEDTAELLARLLAGMAEGGAMRSEEQPSEL